jgi:hypothetical protein
MCARAWRLLVSALLAAAVALRAATPLLAADQAPTSEQQDLVLGTWTLNVAKSKYVPGSPPKSQTRIYDMQGDRVKTTVVTVDSTGSSTQVEYVAKYDSVEYPISGSSQADAISLTRIDPYTAEATLTHAGKIIGTARRVISRDGGTMTITFQSGPPNNPSINNVAVYERRK